MTKVRRVPRQCPSIGRMPCAEAAMRRSCHASMLTPARPCTRCMKKGIGDQCVEGVRKKAKYLMEGDERSELTHAVVAR